MLEKLFTWPIVCGHCQNIAPMEILARHEDKTVVEWNLDAKYPDSMESGTTYELCRCAACEKVNVLSYTWCEWDEENTEVKYLYPVANTVPDGVPKDVKDAYEEAQRVKGISVSAYAVMLGRTLEEICDDRGAIGKTLNEKLDDLTNKGEIPKRLADVAHRLRDMRNMGAHASIGKLSPNEVPILDNLIRALLEYLYSASNYIKLAEERLDELKKPKKTK